ncbi:MAG: HDIG domain-containing protein [Clostridiales bacterium]|nr:HDIG domain-containing protein [Clostridiales bacterium]
MAKREGKRQITKKNIRMISSLLLAVTFVIAYFCVLTVMLPKHYDVKVGEPSPYTIYATQNVTDETATAALKEAARNSAGVVYEIDETRIDACMDGANVFFNGISAVRKQAEMMRGADVLEPVLSEEGWGDALTAEQKANLCVMTAPNLNEGQLCAVLAAGVSDIQFLKDLVLPKMQTSLDAGLSEEVLDSVKNTCIREVNATTSLTAGLKNVGALLIDSYMEPTLVADENATVQAQEDAAAAVEPVLIQKGDAIIKRGDVLSAEQYALLGQLSLVRDGQSNLPLIFGVLLILAAVFALYTVFLLFIREDVFYDTKRMVILTVFTVLVLLVALLCNQVDARMSPALIAIMLTALLVCPSTALALTAVLSIVMGLMACGTGTPLLGTESFMMLVSTFASGTAAVFALRKTESRGSLVAAGAIGGAAAAAAAAALMVLERQAFLSMLLSIGYAVGSAMLSTLLVVGSLSVWENLFDVATSARLNELSNTNHPLLKQLMLEAPGTYQHCTTVAALAEAAAERIGANALLARVGALFHDVGKLRRPGYFKENQKSGENIHDSLPPLESAQTIIAHQKDGVTLLTRHKLPSSVIRIAGEHHGNSLMTYFYYKAKQAEGGDSVQMKNFRYSGNRPSTKESAIVMLADSCEAAVRSLGDTKKEAMEEMVHKVIYGKMTDSDNMMTNAPLTLAEFTEIEKSFIKTFGGIMHDRIEYPDLEEVNKK